MLSLYWLYFATFRNRLWWNLHAFDRYPPAAVDSFESCAPAWGGGAHQSGVPGLEWALWRKRYLHKTTRMHLPFFDTRLYCRYLHYVKRIKVCPCSSKVGRPSCTPRLILLQPSSSTSSSQPEEAGLSLMVRQTRALSAHVLSQKGRTRQRFCKAPMSTQRDDEPSFPWQVCFHQPVFLFCLCFFPLCQDSSTRSWGASWRSASRPTSSTGTRLPRPRWLKSVAWRGSTTRSSSRICSLRPVWVLNDFCTLIGSTVAPQLVNPEQKSNCS